jgi:hypothetical protein
MIEQQTSTSMLIDASGIDPRQPRECFARGVNHRLIAATFFADLAAHHELVALLVAETPTDSRVMSVEPPLCAPIAANAPNAST